MRMYVPIVVRETEDGRVAMIDTRIGRWLMQWLDREEAIKTALSMSPKRLWKLIDVYRSEIERMPWSKV